MGCEIGVDTVGFRVVITYEQFEKIKQKSMVTQRICKSDGEVVFEYDNGQVKYSWNYNVLYKFTDEYWTYDDKNKMPYLESGIPYIQFEFSVPKVLCGHNLHSYGLSSVLDACWLVSKGFEKVYGVTLPPFRLWYCYRLDTCANFLLEGLGQVRNYLEYLQKLHYPRREPLRYGTGIYFPSRTNTLKIYGKGWEFKKHDRTRLELFDCDNELQTLANCILRVEIENKRKIRYEIEKYNAESKENAVEGLNDWGIKTFGGYPRFYDLCEVIDMKKEFERVLSVLLCGVHSHITDSLSAENKLRAVYSARQSASFIAVYYTIVTQGELYAARHYNRVLLWRAKRAFRECGISLLQSDVVKMANKEEYGFPSDFTMALNDDNKYWQKPKAA